MKPPNLNPNLPANDLGSLLRYWREVRGKSQLDLYIDTGVSQRHLSFIESGRSVPSRQKLTVIAQALDVPLRDRNSLLLAAGYAPVYSDGAWDSQEMRSINRALERMLQQHEPFPAMVMDRHWNVLVTNESAPRFFNRFIDLSARKGPRNILHLIFDPKGMRPFIANWEDAAKGLLERVYRESVGRVLDEKTKELLAALHAYPEVKFKRQTFGTPNILPVIPLSFVKGDFELNYFSMVATVGTPQTITAQELRLECMFPADEETEVQHAAFMNEASEH